jgi:hypothetical protein
VLEVKVNVELDEELRDVLDTLDEVEVVVEERVGTCMERKATPLPTGFVIEIGVLPATTGLSARSPQVRNMTNITDIESTDAALVGIPTQGNYWRILPIKVMCISHIQESWPRQRRTELALGGLTLHALGIGCDTKLIQTT